MEVGFEVVYQPGYEAIHFPSAVSIRMESTKGRRINWVECSVEDLEDWRAIWVDDEFSSFLTNCFKEGMFYDTWE